ncbi:MAG: alpha/beta hydrolase [Ilyomonas sp.]
MKHAFFIIVSFCFMMNVQAQTVLPLYGNENIPNSKPSKDEEKSEWQNGRLIISKISRPTLTVYLPQKEKANGAAVVICPGGGYGVNAASHEGSDVAKRFTEAGVAAFVLKYRIPDDATMINKEIGPLQDAQQAIKTVRMRAKEWNLDTARVGIMGFSAGGHLASTAGTHYNQVVIDNKEKINLRPTFMMLIYPVISFQDSIGHIGSRDNLLGKNPSQEKKNEYSNEMQVTDNTPPTFLVHANDDNGVNPKNSSYFYLALLNHHVPSELHIYQTGGHGFGMHMPKSKEEWMQTCINWMDTNGWLGKK